MALEMCNKSYEYKLLNVDFKAVDIKSVAPSATTYPVILIDGEYIGGFDELMKVLLWATQTARLYASPWNVRLN